MLYFGVTRDSLTTNDKIYIKEYVNAKMSHPNVDGLDEFAVRTIQTFCSQIKSLSFEEDFRGLPRAVIARANELLAPAKEYLFRIRKTLSTTEEVEVIVLKLNEAVEVIKKLYPDEILEKMITDCGPTLKAYLDYIDANHSNQLKCKNDWIVTNTKMCSQESMLSDMRHLLDGWNIEQNVKYNGHVSLLDS